MRRRARAAILTAMAPRDFPVGGYTSDYLAFWGVWLALLGLTTLFFRATRARKGPARLVTGNLLVFACLLWAAALAAETYLRYVYDASDSYGLTLTNYNWFGRHVRTNAQGYRDREFDAVPRAGVTRVACVGDSFTFGYGVADPADTWPQRLGAALEARAPGRYDVRNCGVVGLETGGEASLVRLMLAQGSADRVILGYCLNDAGDLLALERRFQRETTQQMTWIAPWRSYLADTLWYRLRLRADPRVVGYFDWVEEAYADPSIVAAQTERCAEIAATCRAASVPLDVVVFPFFSAWGEPYRFDAAHDTVAEIWKSVGVDVVDLRATYRGVPGSELVVNRFDAHPNERAQALAAETILARLFPAR